MIKRVIGSSILLVARSLSLKFLGMLSTLVLARVLMPEDFGLVALATLFLGFMEVFTRTGASAYMLRATDIDDDLVNSAWTLDVILKATLAVVMLIVAPYVGEAYSEPRVVPILWTLGCLALVSSLKSTGPIRLSRNQTYGKIVSVALIAKLCAAIFAVLIALIFKTYWALIIGKIVNTLVTVVGSYFIHPARPSWCTRRIGEQYKFSGWIMVQGLFGYARNQFDTFLVSTEFGNKQLGSFHTMKYFAFIPNSQIILPATEPLLRELSKHRENRSYFRTQYNVACLVTATIAFPLCSIMAANSLQIVQILLGPNWTAYANIFNAFCYLIPAYFFFQQATRTCYIFGKSNLTVVYEVVAFLIIMVPLITLGMAEIVEFARLRVNLELASSFLFFSGTIVWFTGGRNFARLLWLLIPICVACLVAALSAQALVSFTNPILQVACYSLCYAFSFLATAGSIVFLFYSRTREWRYLIDKSLIAFSSVAKIAGSTFYRE